MNDLSDCNKLSIVMRKHNKMVTAGNAGRSQRGAIAPMAAILLIPLLSFLALAIDMSYRHVVRNELQNAADAAALTGAAYLYPSAPGTTTPNFTLAQTKASNAVGLNKAANITLVTGTGVPIVTGYWNIAGKTGGVYKGVHSPADAPIPNQVNDFPAVQVTISKAGGDANSAVNTFFAKAFGMNSLSVSATAVAVGGISPSYTTKNLFPVAVTKCLIDNFWDSSTNTPKIVDSSNPNPYEIIIGSAYHNPSCSDSGAAGQWSTLDLDENDVPTLEALIELASGKTPTKGGKIPNPYNPQFDINDTSYIQPGTENALYDDVDACSARGDKTCEYEVFPVVCPPIPKSSECDSLKDNKKQNLPIVGFVCLHILEANKNHKDKEKKKSISVEIVPMGSAGTKSSCKVPGGGIGPNYGVGMPPRLVNYSGNTY